MQINILGPVSVQSGTQRRSINSKQVRSLLAILALSAGKVVSTNHLISALWNDDGIKNSKNALQATVTRLRRVLDDLQHDGSNLLRTVAEGYVLDLTPLAVDAFQFIALTERAGALKGCERQEALRHYDAGLALWQGAALEDVCDLLAVRAEQARLNECRIAALEACAEIRLELGQTRTVVRDLRHLTEIHGEREHLTGLLMLALYRDGQQTEALDIFQRLRARLRTELGVDPSTALRRLHMSILGHDPALEHEQARTIAARAG